MSDRLRSLLELVAGSGIDLDVDAVLDALWLAMRIDERTPEAAAQTAEHGPASAAAAPPQPVATARPAATASAEPARPPVSPAGRPAADPAPGRTHATPASGETSVAGVGTSLRLRTASALPNARELERGMRPLRVAVPSPGRIELDIEATVLRAAEEEIWLPVVRPAPERWLDLVLVADASVSMVVWRDTVHALRRAFERSGAFRKVHLAWLASEAADPHLHASGRGGSAAREAHLEWFAAEPRRSFVLVVSDCIARGWQNGAVPELLRAWSRRMPVALLHTLPRHLWSRTALGDAVPVRLRAAAGGVTNTRLHWTAESPALIGAVSFVLPVASLTEDSVHRLARLIAGEGGGAPGMLFEECEDPGADLDDAGAAQPDAKQRVEWFLALASAPAVRLASALAASPVTTVRVLRLLREDLLPGDDQSREAEVLIGGILRVRADGALLGALHDDVELEFIDGVRPLLLDGVIAGDALRSLERAAEYAASAGRDTSTFLALIRQPAAHEGAVDPSRPDADPFLRISSDVLRRLGGAYARTVRAPAEQVRVRQGAMHTDESAADSASSEAARIPGVHVDAGGVHFTLFSEHATAVRLELFDHPDATTAHRTVTLERSASDLWHAYVPEIGPGQLYGYRIDGPHEPRRGHRFNPARLLLDPYARAIAGRIEPDDVLYGQGAENLVTDSAPAVPKCMVVDPALHRGEDTAPGIPWERTVIYEAHVRGMTMRHPGVPEHLRGTFAGLASEPVIEHLLRLGVTAVQLMPVQAFVDDPHLLRRGLRNYWGYGTIGFFAPDARYATGDTGEQVREFRDMVGALHAAGIEVILDVAYSHTGEGSHLGPTLSLRGIDNAAYYRLDRSNPELYRDLTGTGNTLNIAHPRVLQLILDSLRFWVEAMNVDGFRFDLAPTLGRDDAGRFDRSAPFFESIRRDPVLSRVKLIAEPWDVGEGGYLLGNFPFGWSEWNVRYRDCVRRFWAGMPGQLPEMLHRLSGSADLFSTGEPPRSPLASINYVSSHDGFTLHDLVSYERKHNEANGQENRDGEDWNNSRNWGEEGPAEDPLILGLRRRTMKNFLATLAFSRGVPMISHGDELGRTQHGNNNAYAQDSEITWLDWELRDWQYELLEFTRRVLELRHASPMLRVSSFQDPPVTEDPRPRLSWIRADGEELGEEVASGAPSAFGMLLMPLGEETLRGRVDDGLLLLLNNAAEPVQFALPKALMGRPCIIDVDTERDGPGPHGELRSGYCDLAAHALVLLRFTRHTDRPTHEPRRPVQSKR